MEPGRIATKEKTKEKIFRCNDVSIPTNISGNNIIPYYMLWKQWLDLKKQDMNIIDTFEFSIREDSEKTMDSQEEK